MVFLSKQSDSKLLPHCPTPQRAFYQDWVISSVIMADLQWNHSILMAVTVSPTSLIFKQRINVASDISSWLWPYCPLPLNTTHPTCKWKVIKMENNLNPSRISLHPPPLFQTITHSWVVTAIFTWWGPSFITWLLFTSVSTSPTWPSTHAMLLSQWGPKALSCSGTCE